MKEIVKFMRQGWKGVSDTARQTGEHFGPDKAQQFLMSASDGLTIKFAIMDNYGRPALMNLLNTQAWGLVKELKWLQFLFLAGNYPLVKSRLRYVWEVMYRAYFVEAHADPEVRVLGPDDKLAWMEKQRPALDWKNCVGVVLKDLLPVADKSGKVFERYRSLWKELNCYVHPSAYVQTRMVDDSSLLMADSFDPGWGEDTLLAGRMVADVVWLALLSFYKKAIPAVAGEKLGVLYPLTATMLRKGKKRGPTTGQGSRKNGP